MVAAVVAAGKVMEMVAWMQVVKAQGMWLQSSGGSGTVNRPVKSLVMTGTIWRRAHGEGWRGRGTGCIHGARAGNADCVRRQRNGRSGSVGKCSGDCRCEDCAYG